MESLGPTNGLRPCRREGDRGRERERERERGGEHVEYTRIQHNKSGGNVEQGYVYINKAQRKRHTQAHTSTHKHTQAHTSTHTSKHKHTQAHTSTQTYLEVDVVCDAHDFTRADFFAGGPDRRGCQHGFATDEFEGVGGDPQRLRRVSFVHVHAALVTRHRDVLQKR